MSWLRLLQQVRQTTNPLRRHLLPRALAPIVGQSGREQWEWNPSSPPAWRARPASSAPLRKECFLVPAAWYPRGRMMLGGSLGKALWLELMTIGAGAGREWVGGSFQNSSGLLASISVLFPDSLRGSPLWSRPLRGPWELRENKPDSDSPETGPRGPGLPILGRAADHLNSIRCLASPPSRSCCLSRARGCLATPLSRRLDGCALPFVSAGIGSHGVA